MLSQATRISLHTETAQLLLGIEQEFDLFSGGEKLDFRSLFPSIISRVATVPFRDLDIAAALDAGYMLACDEDCAEFATVPISYFGSGLPALAREVTRCRRHFLDLMKKNGVDEVRGYSTHMNIRVPAGSEREIAETAASTFAPGLILLMEARTSPGLLIRPRRGRLEIGSEYIDDEDQLTAALVFLTGAVQAYLQNDSIWQEFPRVRLNRREEANIRPGIYLPHDAYGKSPYECGRETVLELEGGGKITAGELMTHCADLILRELDGQVDAAVCEKLLAFARGGRSLQIERMADPSTIAHRRSGKPAPESKNMQMIVSAPTAFGLTPRFVDWEGVAFSLDASSEPTIIGMPWYQLPDFFNQVREGGAASAVPRLEGDSPVLNSIEQLRTAQTYKEVDAAALGNQAREWKKKKFLGQPRLAEPRPATGPVRQPVLPDNQQESAAAIAMKRPTWWIAAVLVAVAVIGLGWWLLGREPKQPSLISPSQIPRTVESASPGHITPFAASVPLRIVITTSSDWTTVGVFGAEPTAVKILSSSPGAIAPGFDSSLGQFNLNQPIERAGNESVTMTAEFSLNIDVTENIDIVIGRGFIGATTVELYVVQGSGQTLIKTFKWAGIGTEAANIGTFEVASALLLNPTQVNTGTVEQIPARIRVVTSSDWTSVSMKGPNLSRITIRSASPEATMAGYDEGLGQFNLNQPIERAGTKAVELVADFYISAASSETIAFMIGRGHIGATTVNLYVMGGSTEILIGTFQWSGINPDALNIESFNLDPSLFDVTQGQSGMNVGIRASFCSNEVGGVSFNTPDLVTDVNEFHVVAEGKDLDCVIVEGRLACTGMTPASTVSGTICKGREGILARCVDFTVQIPACKAQNEGEGGGGGEGGVTGVGETDNECPAGQTNYCDPPHPGEVAFCGCH